MHEDWRECGGWRVWGRGCWHSGPEGVLGRVGVEWGTLKAGQKKAAIAVYTDFRVGADRGVHA